MALSLDIHVLQTVPPSCINRDDTNSPKTAVFGGVRRARVSSQAWKRATRVAFDQSYDRSELGVRTKRVVELLATEIESQARDLSDEKPAELAAAALKAAGIKLTAPKRGKDEEQPFEESGYLLFLSRSQVRRLAELAVAAERSGGTGGVSKKDAQRIFKETNSVDVALFGRMVADVSDLRVDAACQVAHALSTHAVETEFDYFTAVDDHKQEDDDEDAGAGMIGTVEFNSSTLYRYATINIPQLEKNLGDREASLRAIEAFVEAFVTSMPTGKQNTFANRTLPELIHIALRDDQPISLVGAFEQPVSATGGHAHASARALQAWAQQVTEAYGRAPRAAWHVAVGDIGEGWDTLSTLVSFDRLAAVVRAEVDAALPVTL